LASAQEQLAGTRLPIPVPIHNTKDSINMSRILRHPGAYAALLALAIQPLTTQALDESDFNFDTTEDLLQVCGASGDSVGAIEALLACRAFLEATVQYHDAVSDSKRMKRLVCYKPTDTIDGAREAFVAWGAKHNGDQKLMAEMPVVGVIRALASARPCK
jgi:hypothetical protein